MKNIIYESHHDKNPDLKLFKANNTVVSPHFHRSFEMLYIIEGEIKAIVGDKSFVAKKDDVVFVQKYYSHSYDVVKNYSKYVLIIPPNIYNDFEDVLSNKTLPALLDDKEFNKNILKIIMQLENKFENKTILVKKGYINIIMGELINHYKLENIKRNSNIDLLIGVLDYIDKNYYKEITLEDISNEFGYSKYYFSRLFNQIIKENINEYINMVRIQEVMKRIRNNKENITSTAYECGFSSLATFYRCYKKMYGVSPKQKLENY